MRDNHIVLQDMGTAGTQPPTKGRAKNDVMALSPQQGPPPRQVVHSGDVHWEGSQSPVEPWLCPQERLSYKESTKNSAWDDGRPLCFFHSNQNLQLEIICKRWLLQFPPPPASCPEQLSETTSVHKEGQPEATSSGGLQRHKPWEPCCMRSGSAQHPLTSPRWNRAGPHLPCADSCTQLCTTSLHTLHTRMGTGFKSLISKV